MNIISVIGLPRSGTTLLGRVLAASSGGLYHEEPNPLWRYRNWVQLDHDQFEATHATPSVRRHIRGRLIPDSIGERYVIEKTPANALRVGFVEAVLPEVKIVFITRNGQDIERSMVRKWIENVDENAKGLQDERYFRDMRGRIAKLAYVHWSELGVYAISELKSKFDERNFWGPQFLGWRQVANNEPKKVISESRKIMESRLSDGIKMCRSPHCIIAYEDLISSPLDTLLKISTDLDCGDLDIYRGLKFFNPKT